MTRGCCFNYGSSFVWLCQINTRLFCQGENNTLHAFALSVVDRLCWSGVIGLGCKLQKMFREKYQIVEAYMRSLQSISRDRLWLALRKLAERVQRKFHGLYN